MKMLSYTACGQVLTVCMKYSIPGEQFESLKFNLPVELGMTTEMGVSSLSARGALY